MNGRRLLVVDDEAQFADFVRTVAESIGYEVRVAGDAVGFREAYHAFRPSVLMIDIVMPKTDGIELVQWLAGEKSDARTLLVTGYDSRYTKTAKALGELKGLTAVETYTKPIGLSDLKAALA